MGWRGPHPRSARWTRTLRTLSHFVGEGKILTAFYFVIPSPTKWERDATSASSGCGWVGGYLAAVFARFGFDGPAR